MTGTSRLGKKKQIVLGSSIRYLGSVPMSKFTRRYVPMCSMVLQDRPARVARV